MLTATFPARSDLVAATKRAYDAFSYRSRSIASPPSIPWELLDPQHRQAWIDAAQELVDSADYDEREPGLMCCMCASRLRKCVCRPCKREQIVKAIEKSSRAQKGVSHAASSI